MNKIIQNLLKVKSIITILTTVVFCIMLVCSIFLPITIPQEFMMIYTTIIAFYFGTLSGKADAAAKLAKNDEQVQQILETDN